jgi:hypothetical protein
MGRLPGTRAGRRAAAGIVSQAIPVLTVALSVGGVGFAVVTASSQVRGIEQPLSFNHKAHVDRGLECADCHKGVRAAAHAAVPSIAVCAECHSGDADAASQDPEKKRLVAHVVAGTEIPWRRLYRLPAHVVFSHERHVTMGEIACEACHGRHGESEVPPPRPEALSMAGCMDCHATRDVTVDCIACHR